MYEVIFRARFERTFRKLDKKTQVSILDELELLAQEPFEHPHVRCISGIKQKAYRIRIGRWRVLYMLITKQKTIEVIDVFMKKGLQDYKERI